ncbi:hypothetical protein DXG03_006450 [Asterophora parasitica]|uniref:G-protein coupled receptors family 2 profile 2 domain-containing protein n=1 Tax=Asterophora parasitica TaxID=117018 RepID=A0A9P7G103_9AGAR|nr:hypothetical protein DXG03_006450 [Asterophora parasitica]
MSPSSSSGDVFSPSEEQMNFAGDLAYACTIPGTIVCALALVAYAVVASYPHARKHLDRVSFRILVQALISNIFYGIAFAVTPMHPGNGCDFGAFAINLTLCLATFYTTCIAINLQLVLVHEVNGKMLEKYYIIVTVVLSLALNVPTYALGQFGWNALSETCWYSNDDKRKRLQWIIATQSFWISLAALTETVCSVIVLYWLYRFKRSIHSITRNATPSGRMASSDYPPRTSIALNRDPRFRKIVLRIALYPMVSLLLNISTVALDLNMSLHELRSRLDYYLLVIDLFMYGIRTFAYGALAFGDPSFINGIQEILSRRRTRSAESNLTNLDFANTEITTHGGDRIEVDVELQHISTGSDVTQSKCTTIGTLGSVDDVKTFSPSQGGHQRPFQRKYGQLSQEEEHMISIGRQL